MHFYALPTIVHIQIQHRRVKPMHLLLRCPIIVCIQRQHRCDEFVHFYALHAFFTHCPIIVHIQSQHLHIELILFLRITLSLYTFRVNADT